MRALFLHVLPLLVILSAGGCAPFLPEVPIVPVTAASEEAGTEVSPPPATATPQPADPLHCEAPYSEDSLWNTPIDWQRARIHPLSDKMMAAFFKRDDWIGSDTTQYAPNIYFVDEATPLAPVALWSNRSFRDAFDGNTVLLGQPGETVWVPLPSHARPAPGTDGELVVVNIDTGEEWGLAKAHKDLNGGWSAGGVYRYHIGNSGVPPMGFAQRGAGIGSLAGIVRPCEVVRGEIGHAVTIAYDYPCTPEVCARNGWPAFIPPFTKTDGEGTSQFDIPEGARLVIRPDVTDVEIGEACGGMLGCITWVKAMQTYGGFIVDNSGHPKTYGEGSHSANWDPAVWSSDMLRNIPTDWYAVLDWDVPAN
ncbi:MAG: hypothetical protein HY869_12205 [Chloroflexi bacterium]|nr:hypothetical protein [Chloroflexota bacterium]